METSTCDNRMQLLRGDITRLGVDVIVNAANSGLLGGGGVDGARVRAIHRAGGPEILAACREIRNRQGGCPPGEAIITTAGKLPARFVVHTVGPVWNGGGNNEDHLLAACYQNSLRLAVANGATTIAFPNISTGVYRFPRERAAQIAIREVTAFLAKNNTLERVIFVCYDEENYSIYSDRIYSGSIYSDQI